MGIEHVFIEYDPAKPINRFELGTRKLVRTIELEHFKVEAAAPAPLPTITSFVISREIVQPNAPFTITSVFQNGTGRVGRGLSPTQWTTVTSQVALTQTITQDTDFTLEVLGTDGITKRTATESILVGPTISSFVFSNYFVYRNVPFTITSVFQNGTGRVGRGLLATQWTTVTSGVPLTQTVTQDTDFLLEVTGNDGITKVTEAEYITVTSPFGGFVMM